MSIKINAEDYVKIGEKTRPWYQELCNFYTVGFINNDVVRNSSTVQSTPGIIEIIRYKSIGVDIIWCRALKVGISCSNISLP